MFFLCAGWRWGRLGNLPWEQRALPYTLHYTRGYVMSIMWVIWANSERNNSCYMAPAWLRHWAALSANWAFIAGAECSAREVPPALHVSPPGRLPRPLWPRRPRRWPRAGGGACAARGGVGGVRAARREARGRQGQLASALRGAAAGGRRGGGRGREFDSSLSVL